MSFPPSVYKTWVAGETLTAADLNNSFLAPINSNIPEDIDDFSVNAAEMQTTTDPYPASVESLATSLSEEISRLRYVIKQISGATQWYTDPDSDITTLFKLPTTIAVNLSVSCNSDTVVGSSCDEIILSNSSLQKVRLVSPSIATADITTSGLGGLDTGAEAGNTWYYIWIIYNGTLTSCLLSASSTAPTMPSGYTYKALVGAVRNNGSSNFLRFQQQGAHVMYRNTLPDVKAFGAVASGTVAVAGQSGTASVPPTAKIVQFRVDIEASWSDTARKGVSFAIAPGGFTKLEQFKFEFGSIAGSTMSNEIPIITQIDNAETFDYSTTITATNFTSANLEIVCIGYWLRNIIAV